jgi:hypothetical protein
MNEGTRCPLSPALLDLLRVAAERATTDTESLAGVLGKSPETIHSDFSRICGLVDVHDRGRAVLTALKRGWIALPDADSG